MAIQQEMTLNEAQLELLLEPKLSATLGAFKEATHASAAARELKLPANKTHYYVKRLAGAGLLTAMGRQGKAILYEATALTYLIPQALVPQMGLGMPEMMGKMLDQLKLGMKKSIDDKLDPNCNERCAFSFEENTESGSSMAFSPRFEVHELNLSPRDYEVFQHKLTDLIKSFKNAEAKHETKACTFAVISFQGETGL